MFGVGILELVVLLVLLLLLARWLVAVATRPVPAAAPRPSSRESQQIALVRLAALVVGTVCGSWVLDSGSHGRGLISAPAVFGLVVLVGVALGETLVRPRPSGTVRTASARARRVRDYLPRRLAGVVGVQAVALVGVLVLTTLTASRDAYTDSMRALSCGTAAGGSERTPYPGSFYTVPLAGVLVLVLLVALLAARQVVRRPRGDGGSDAALRARSLGVVTAAVGVAVGAPYVMVALNAGVSLQLLGDGVPGCAPRWADPVGTGLAVSALLAGALVLVCASLLVVGRPGFAPAEGEVDRPVAR